MSGMPARTKAASCREKFMTSVRFTFFLVSSILRSVGRGLSVRPYKPWSASISRASFGWSAVDDALGLLTVGRDCCVLELRHGSLS